MIVWNRWALLIYRQSFDASSLPFLFPLLTFQLGSHSTYVTIQNMHITALSNSTTLAKNTDVSRSLRDGRTGRLTLRLLFSGHRHLQHRSRAHPEQQSVLLCSFLFLRSPDSLRSSFFSHHHRRRLRLDQRQQHQHLGQKYILRRNTRRIYWFARSVRCE